MNAQTDNALADLETHLQLLDGQANFATQLLRRSANWEREIASMRERGEPSEDIAGAREVWLRLDWEALWEQKRYFWFESESAEFAVRYLRPEWPFFGPLSFERLCRAALMLVYEQFHELTPQTRDGGFDLLFRETRATDSGTAISLLTLGQCKLLRSALGVEEMREFLGALAVRGASSGTLFCLAGVSGACHEELIRFNRMGTGVRAAIVSDLDLRDFFDTAAQINDCWNEYIQTNEELETHSAPFVDAHRRAILERKMALQEAARALHSTCFSGAFEGDAPVVRA